MKLVNSIRMGAWFVILLSLFMAFGSIWVFLRMSPVIDKIIKQNTRTLVSCEKMLANIAQLTGNEKEDEVYKAAFIFALDQAKMNVTEKEEPDVIEEISVHYQNAFAGDRIAKKRTVQAIVKLSYINKNAMIIEDQKARKFGSAGAWGVVFMATAVFFVATLLMRSIRRNLIYPLEEIFSVIEANLNGDSLRRCFGSELSRDVKILYDGVNEVLDSAKKSVIDNIDEKNRLKY